MARIYLTGRMALEGDGSVVEELELPGVQGRVALAALVLAKRPLARDSLAEIIWAEALPQRWEKALSPIVSKLRTLLDRVGIDGRASLVTSAGALEFRRLSPITVDIEVCMNSLDTAEGALRRRELEIAWSDAAVASSIARNSFLPGVGADWVEEQRRNLEEAHVRALDVLTDVWRLRDDGPQAVSIAEQLVRLDPLREQSHRKLIEAFGVAGDAAAAARAYRRCVSLLAERLDVVPSQATADAYRRSTR